MPLIVPETTYSDKRIDLRMGVRATRLDTQRGVLELDDGSELHADKVLLATGGRARRLQVPGADLPGVCYVRSAEDAELIRAGSQPGARVAVIGGGLIGAEVAATAIQAGCKVDLIEADYRCLTRAISHPLDEVMMAIHHERGVRIHTGAAVVRILGDSRATGVELAGGQWIDADLVVVGVGIVPAVELAQAAGARIDNGIVVDAYGATSLPNVFAAGDVACCQTRYMAAPGRLEHWKHAQGQGAAAARAMLGLNQPYDEVPWFWTDQYQHHVEGCGLPRTGDEVVLRGNPADASATAFYLRDGHLTAAVALNRSNDVRAAMRLIARGLTPDRDALRDPQRDLRKLEKELSRAVA